MRYHEIIEKIEASQGYQELKQLFLDKNEELKKKHKKNKPVLKDVTEINTESEMISFTLKGFSDIEFTVMNGYQWIMGGKGLKHDAHETKGYRAYVGWTNDIIEQIKEHKKVRLLFITGALELNV